MEKSQDLNVLLSEVLSNPPEIATRILSELDRDTLFYITRNNLELYSFATPLLINKSLDIYLGGLKKEFIDILIQTKSIISGGCLLGCLNEENTEINDIDVYVNQRNIKHFIKFFLVNNFSCIEYCTIPAYDGSFMKQNNIMGRMNFALNGIIIDLIIIKDDTEINSVVSNFDLTFCEIKFDGITVHADNIENIMKKRGFLRKQYVKKLMTTLNEFTIGRIRKYISRGYKIKYEKINTDEIDIFNVIQYYKINNEIEYVFSKLYQSLLKTCALSLNSGKLLKLQNEMLLEFEMRENRMISDDLIQIAIMIKYPFVEKTEAEFDRILTSVGYDISSPELKEEVYTSLCTKLGLGQSSSYINVNNHDIFYRNLNIQQSEIEYKPFFKLTKIL